MQTIIFDIGIQIFAKTKKINKPVSESKDIHSNIEIAKLIIQQL